MFIVNNYYDVKVVEVVFSGSDNLGFFENKISFIYNPLDDLYDMSHSIYDCCDKVVKDLKIGSQTIEHATAYIYTLDRQLVHQFSVID